MRCANTLEVQVVFLYGLEAIESQVIVGLGEGSFSLLVTVALMFKTLQRKHKCVSKHNRVVLREAAFITG